MRAGQPRSRRAAAAGPLDRLVSSRRAHRDRAGARHKHPGSSRIGGVADACSNRHLDGEATPAPTPSEVTPTPTDSDADSDADANTVSNAYAVSDQ